MRIGGCSYRYQLEQFVDRVKGRESKSEAWVDHEDLVRNLEMVDMAYKKRGLVPMPSGTLKAN